MTNWKERIKESELPEQVKFALTESLERLSDHEEKVMDELKREIKGLLEEREEADWQIVTILVPKSAREKMADLKFFPVPESINAVIRESKSIFSDDGEAKEGGPFFLTVPYEEIKDICSKKYTARSSVGDFTYSLVPHSRFLYHEQTLHKLKNLYKKDMPLLFNPYARRAVDIRADICVKDLKDADFAFSDNGLEGKITDDCILIWNVEIKPNKVPDSYPFTPKETAKKYMVYRFKDIENTFYMPRFEDGENHFEDMQIIKDNGDIVFKTPHAVNITDARPITVYKADFKEIKRIMPDSAIFVNTEESKPKKERLRTLGEISDVLESLKISVGSFKYRGEIFTGSIEDEGLEPIEGYDEGFGYPDEREQELILLLRTAPCLTILFHGSLPYLTDYAEMTLHYLNEHYPEYFWRGVYKP